MQTSINKYVEMLATQKCLADQSIRTYKRLLTGLLASTEKSQAVSVLDSMLSSAEGGTGRANSRATIKYKAGIVCGFLKFIGIDAYDRLEAFHVGKKEVAEAKRKRESLALSDEDMKKFMAVEFKPSRNDVSAVRHVPR